MLHTLYSDPSFELPTLCFVSPVFRSFWEQSSLSTQDINRREVLALDEGIR